MKILYVNNFFSNVGGAEESIFKEYKLLEEKGHETCFFTTDKGEFLELACKYNHYFPKYIDYKSLPKWEALKYCFEPFYNFEAEKRMSLFLKEIKPDIVRVHNIFYHLTPSVINACHKQNIPVVMTLHDPKLMCPSGTLQIKNERYCRKKLCVGGNPAYCLLNKCKYGSLRASLVVTAEYLFHKQHKIFDKVSYYICPSKAMLKLAEQSGIKKDKLILINHFIKDSMMKTSPEYQNNGYFLFIGRLSKEKGVHHLIEAMTMLPKSLKLHIIGTGPEEENLKNQANESNLDNIVFLGFKKGEELEKEYKSCIATVLPCNWFETFGLTVIESFVYGKPVIASNIGALPELVIHNKNGFVCEPDNVEQFATAMEKLYCNQALAALMGKNARQSAEELYSSDIYYSKLIKILEEIKLQQNAVISASENICCAKDLKEK